jgi:hypothetical protein
MMDKGWGMRVRGYQLIMSYTYRAQILKHSMEAKKSTFQAGLLFKGQSVQQGLQWLQLFVLLLKTILCKS